jgi:hypothetical protein
MRVIGLRRNPELTDDNVDQVCNCIVFDILPKNATLVGDL